MCKVHNSIGSLKQIKSHLRDHGVNDFKSVNELIQFQRTYSTTHQQIISNHSTIVEREKNILNEEVSQLKEAVHVREKEAENRLRFEIERLNDSLSKLSAPHSNLLKGFLNYIKKLFLRRQVQNAELNFKSKVQALIQPSVDNLSRKSTRFQYISSNFKDAVTQSSLSEIRELERRKAVVDEINPYIYGAIGEQKVAKELETLSDDYILINDFACSFHPPIYNRQEDDRIRSIQIDHLLISPSGIFLIETKNWSEQSLKNLSLHSPVDQIKRTNFALFNILSKEIKSSTLWISKHHWGDRKVPIRNLIVLINQKPNEEFQYVKILTLRELLRYIEYFKPCLSNSETQQIANYLLRLSN